MVPPKSGRNYNPKSLICHGSDTVFFGGILDAVHPPPADAAAEVSEGHGCTAFPSGMVAR